MTDSLRAPLLVLDRATKSFGAVRALEDGSISLFAGEAHALLGENGAGKSTLVKILAGVHQPDSGALIIDGDEIDLRRAGAPRRRRASRSSTRSRRCSPTSPSRRTSSWAASRSAAGAGSTGAQMYGDAARRCSSASASSLDPSRLARGLSVADQQIVEIAKALSFDARVIVMDEPTAALSARRGGAAVRRSSARCAPQGAAVLFISHRLEEVFAICQRVTIMRDGRFVRTARSRTSPSTTSSGRWSAATSTRCSPRRTPRPARWCSRSSD